MLNKIWPIFAISSIVFAICCGNITKLNDSIFSSIENAVTLTLTLLGNICFWNGIMNIASNTTLIHKMQIFLKPFLRKFFPNIETNDLAHKQISMNIIANILGLGNAATPMGLQAMQSMQKNNKNKERLSDDMMMFIVLNTASIQLIPTTVLAIRTSLNSKMPTQIIFPVWIVTIITATITILVTKIFIKRSKND